MCSSDLFIVMLIGWVLFASLSTSSEIFSEHMFKFETGFHFENYIKAWKTQKVSVFFMNSLLYTLVSCTLIVLIASPAAYVLSRFKFKGNMFLQNMFASALGIPIIMIIMPLFGLASMFKLTNTRALIIFLYIAVNVPFTLFYLLAFFKKLKHNIRRSRCNRRLPTHTHFLDYYVSARTAGYNNSLHF